MKPPEWVGKERGGMVGGEEGGGMVGGEEGGAGKRKKETILITYLNFAWASATPPPLRSNPPTQTP